MAAAGTASQTRRTADAVCALQRRLYRQRRHDRRFGGRRRGTTRRVFLYDGASSRLRHDLPTDRVHEPFRCVLDVKASLGECPVWSIAEQVLYWVDINAPALNRFDPATGGNTRDADARVDRLLRVRKQRRIRHRAARRLLARAAATARLTRKVADAPYDPAHHRFNDGRCDRAGPFLRRLHERKARRGHAPRSCASIPISRQPRPRRDDDLATASPSAPTARTMYHADTPTRRHPRLRLRRARPARRESARVRALRPARRSSRRRRRRQRRLLLDRVLWRRQGRCASRPPATCSREYPVPAMCPTMCAFGGPRSEDALRDDRAPAAPRRRARAAAAIGRRLRDVRRRAGLARARVRRMSRAPRRPRMPFDAAAYLRLDAQQSLGASPSGIAFATSTGDVLEVSCYGPGVFRLRVGPDTRPDYGIVVGARASVHRRAHRRRAPGRSPPATRRSRSPARRLRLRLLHQGRRRCCTPAPTCSSAARRACPAIGRLRRGEQWIAAFALASGEPVYGLGEKFGPLNKRGQLVHSQVDDALGVNTGAVVQERAVRVEPRRGAPRRLGRVRAHAGHGHARRRLSRLVASLVRAAWSTTKRSTSSSSRPTRPPASSTCYTQLTGRAPAVPLWSLGLWVSRATTRRRRSGRASRRSCAQRAHSLRRDGARRPRGVGRRRRASISRGIRARFPDPRAALAAIKAHAPARLRLRNIRTSSVDAPLFGELAARGYLLTDARRRPYVVRLGRRAGSETARRRAAALPESGIVDFTQSGRVRLVARRAREAVRRRRRRRSRATSASTCPTMRSPSTATRGRRLHNVYPLLYNQCVYEATTKFQRATRRAAGGLRPRRLGGQPALSDRAGAASRRATGKGSPRRFAARCRGA